MARKSWMGLQIHVKWRTLSSRTGAQCYLRKRIDKIEHEDIGAWERIEINQNADNADEKIKLFVKVHKTFMGSMFLIIFFPTF